MIKQVMKSPFSGGNAVLHCEPSTLTFRKEEFCYIHQFYECEDTHERFTTTELDEANIVVCMRTVICQVRQTERF